MTVSRMDLDDKGAGSPEGLVTRILKLSPNLAPPIPIEQLCKDLDISEIADLTTEGFEGGLITDTDRSRGIILVNKYSHRYRRRFTISHELGHFLMPKHIPDEKGRFLCSRADLMTLTAKESDRRARMEVEANRFASLMIIPPPHLRLQPQFKGDPSLEHIPILSKVFEASKEAIARAYAEYHPQLIAIVIAQNGTVLRIYRNRARFPFIDVRPGQAVPRGSLFFRDKSGPNAASSVDETNPSIWIDVERGRQAPALYEQVYRQNDGFAMIMLWLELPEEEDYDREENLTSKQRYQDRLASRSR